MSDSNEPTTEQCPECGLSYTNWSEHRDECPEIKRQAKERWQKLVQKFQLKAGYPTEADRRASLEEAERRVKALIKREFEYEPKGLLESDAWWYIPHGWIGCAGFIVNKETGHVNWLGSALPLEECFWGQNHGLYTDLVDFSFAPDTDLDLAKGLLSRFKHMHPNVRGIHPKEPVWYRQSEIESALATQFSAFNRHFVWFAIPEIKKAYDDHGLRFTSRLSDEA